MYGHFNSNSLVKFILMKYLSDSASYMMIDQIVVLLLNIINENMLYLNDITHEFILY